MKKLLFILMMVAIFFGTSKAQDMIITGVVDGPLPGGVPKTIELFVLNDIADVSIYGLESANNGAPAAGPEFNFYSEPATAGDFIYVASETDGFNAFFGFIPYYTSNVANNNGDDAIILYMNSTIVDVFGEVGVDGTGQPWEYLDGWAYRVDGTGPDGSTFVLDNFMYSGINALDNETSNSTAATPFPIGTYQSSFTPDPEPTNYPADFTATVDVTDIDVTWTNDETGPQLPDGYLVLAKYEWADDFTLPVDGVPVENDWNFTDDGYYANNVFGNNEENLFMFLDVNTGYDFAIFPYTNSGEFIDYKTDGTYPTASVVTDNVYYHTYEKFDPSNQPSREMMAYNVTGDEEWEWANFGVPPGCMSMSGYAGGAQVNEDWLITSQLSTTEFSNMYLRFNHARNFANNDGLFVMVSTDYTGGDPSVNGTWEDITDLFTFPESGSWNFYDAGIGDVTEYISASTYFAFKYTSTDTDAATWEVDNIRVYSYIPIIDITYPDGGETLYQGQQVDITWDHEYWVEETVALYLSEGTERDLTLITESTPVADGSYTWSVWSSIEPGDEFRIMVTGPEGPQNFSDDFFSIVAGDELIADFEADTTMIYVGDSVMFTDLTIGTPTTWTWTFEGGMPATFEGEEPPYIHYATAGVFDVTLEVFDGVSTDEVTMADYITVMEIPELPAPVNLEGEVTMNYLDVELNWLEPGSNTGDTFEDDFESYDDFVLEFSPWTTLDVDGAPTYGMTDIDWPNLVHYKHIYF